MEVRDKDYCVTYDPEMVTITCQGRLRLMGQRGMILFCDCSMRWLKKNQRSSQ